VIYSRFKTFAIVWSLPIFVFALSHPQSAQARTITAPTVKMPPVRVKTPSVHATGVSSIPVKQLHGSHHIGVNGAFYHPKQISAKGNFGGSGSGSPSTGTACQVVQLCIPNILTGTQCSSQTVCK
jgi:hypothetical protein